MIGSTIESRPSFPLGSVLWLVPALLLVVLSVPAEKGRDVALSSLPFWLMSLFWLWAREPRFQAVFSSTGLEVLDPPERLDFVDMEALLARKRPANPYKAGPPSYPILVVHPNGVIRIPPRLNVPSDEVYGFLYARFGSQGARPVHPDLLDYFRHKEKKHGDDRVWSYRARRYRGRGAAQRRFRALTLAWLVTGVIWAVLGLALNAEGWIGAGVAIAITAVLIGIALFFSAGLQKVSAKLRHSGLVISPDGIALVQADLHGQLRWDEVRSINYQHGKDLILKVEGATIPIHDIYDRPLPLIHQLIHYYRNRDEQEARSPWRFDPHELQDDAAQPTPRGDTSYMERRDR